MKHTLKLTALIAGLLIILAVGCAAPQPSSFPQTRFMPPAPTLAAPANSAAAQPTRPAFGAAPAALEEGDAQTLLAKHNEWRARFGSPPLAWDEGVAAFAQEWADQLAASDSFEHRPDNQFGENLWAGTSGAFPIESVVDDWGNEVNDYDLNTDTCAPGAVCGHFTQVVWANTARLGCGKAFSGSGNDVIVCNYDPPGNFIGESPFAANAQPPTEAATAPTEAPTTAGEAEAPTEEAATAPTEEAPAATTEPVGAVVGGLNDADAQAVLDKHNEWRASFNVPALVWDNAVAAVAQDWANQLAASGDFAHRQGNQYGENLWAGTSGFFPITSAVDNWGNEVNDYDLATNTCAEGAVCGHFTQVVWGNTARLGCGKATGADGWDYVVCNYDPPGNFIGASPFTANAAGGVPTEAPTVAPPAFEPTQEPAAAPTDEPTAVATDEPTVAPTDEPTAVPTDEPTAVPTEVPTAVPTVVPTTQPAAAGLSDADKQSLLSKHNEWRARFNTPALAWDNTVAAVAQDWADQMAASGNFAHRQGNKYGENLYGSTSKTIQVASAVDNWGNEVNNYNLTNNTCNAGKVCGHFTQVVWRNTSKLGCGKATAADGWTYIVCNYDPPGNFVGESPFGN